MSPILFVFCQGNDITCLELILLVNLTSTTRYFNLETEAARFLEEVVLPCLLEVIYYLVVNKNQAISYRYPEIKLYKQ